MSKKDVTRVYMHACMRACMHACRRACVRACVCVRVCVYVCVCERVHVYGAGACVCVPVRARACLCVRACTRRMYVPHGAHHFPARLSLQVPVSAVSHSTIVPSITSHPSVSCPLML